MARIVTFSILLSFFYLYGESQTSLTIKVGTPLFISSGTLFSSDGLVLQPSTGYTINGSNSLTRNTTVSHYTANNYVSRVYDWGSPLTNYTGDITIYYQPSELNGLSQSSLTLNNNDGTQWTGYTANVTRDNTNNFVTTAGLSSLTISEVALSSNMGLLPLVWGPVKAYRNKSEKVIEWTTHSENNVNNFEVQRSYDGVQWTTFLSSIKPFNTEGDHHYAETDAVEGDGKIYYRIKEVEKDGHSSYSTILIVEPISKSYSISLFPNPATSTLMIKLSNGAFLKRIDIFNSEGRLVKSEELGGLESYEINISTFSSGVYTLSIKLSDGTRTNKQFIRQ